MYKLRKKFSSKRRLNSASSSTAGSVSDLEDRVIMMCEDGPNQSRPDWDWSSSRGSRSESGSEPPVIHLSRDRLSNRQACCVDPTHPAMQVYGRVKKTGFTELSVCLSSVQCFWA